MNTTMRGTLAVATAALLGAAAPARAEADAGGPAPAETKEARDARMAWWREARFGMFVHWGLYSGLGGTWKGHSTGSSGSMEWLQFGVKADTWEYALSLIHI